MEPSGSSPLSSSALQLRLDSPAQLLALQVQALLDRHNVCHLIWRTAVITGTNGDYIPTNGDYIRPMATASKTNNKTNKVKTKITPCGHCLDSITARCRLLEPT